ncbi:MAG TPA: hypothetical protein VKE70_17230 [Candidatus Solibacter sp.]|nr:hypothetical protein [Candidatus Solibacter sp.]
MLRTTALLIVSLASFGFGQTPQLVVTSAASSSTTVTAGSLATAYLANLGGDNLTVEVMDSGSVKRPATLLFSSPRQINFQIPAGTALGVATVFVNNGSSAVSTQIVVAPSAPALFAIDNQGIAAATAVRVVIPTQLQGTVPVFICADPGGLGCRLLPIDPGVDAPVYLSFYGTSIGTGDVTVNIGLEHVPAIYAGPQGQFPGLDQVNVQLPLSLHGAGVVDVTITVNGVTSNPVKISVA